MIRHRVERPPDRAEWLRLRLDYFNASDAAALFGEHPFTTLADIAVRKLTRDIDEAATHATRRGTHLEAAIASWWEEENGLRLYEPDVLYGYGNLLATLDRRVTATDDEAVEIKTTNRRILEPLASWVWQCQAQMLCTGFVRIHLVVLDSTLELQTFVITADHDAQAELYERATKFMEHVRRGEIPPDAELTYQHRSRLTPVDDATTVELDDTALGYVTRLNAAGQIRNQAEAEEERVKARLAEILGTARAGARDGRVILTWKTSNRTTFDVTRFRRDHPALAAAYGTTTTQRRMLTDLP
jgi:putative phage-type endonuclease